MVIRQEQPSDITAIFQLTQAAFEHHPFGEHTEQFITNALRDADALTLSLVAEAEGKVVGHVAFSPVTISDGSRNWYGLGPISVLPELQKRGIGTSLIREGLSQLKSLGAEGCVLLGSPAYYERFGFRNRPDLVLEGVPQVYFLALPFEEHQSHGNVSYHEAFSAKG
jgi:putative acetyltransferase